MSDEHVFKFPTLDFDEKNGINNSEFSVNSLLNRPEPLGHVEDLNDELEGLDFTLAPDSNSFQDSKIQHEKYSWPGGPSQKQDFSFPSTIIYYISKNPSSTTQYLKMVQSCKYFFEKLPILIAKNIYCVFDEILICSNVEKKCTENNFECCLSLQLSKIISKIWITNKILFDACNNKNVSMLCQKIYRRDIFNLSIHNQQMIFKDLQIIASSAVEIVLRNIRIIFEDGEIVPLDAILEGLTNVQKFKFYFRLKTIGPSTLKNVAKLENLTNLQKLYLHGIPEIPNVEDFLDVIKKHKDTKIQLFFDKTVSEDFKIQLNSLIDKTIIYETIKCIIRYNGQNDEKLKIMENRFY